MARLAVLCLWAAAMAGWALALVLAGEAVRAWIG